MSVFVSCLFVSNSWSQTAVQLDQWAAEATLESFPMLREILSIPNDGLRPAEIKLNVQWCERSFSRQLDSPTQGWSKC